MVILEIDPPYLVTLMLAPPVVYLCAFERPSLYQFDTKSPTNHTLTA